MKHTQFGSIESLRFWIAGGLFLLTLTLYLNTLAPSVVTLFDDSLEFQLVTYQLGIAHPTGYPLYTLLGKLFTLLPIGNIAYRVNLMSAFFGAATIALLYLLILAIIRGSPWRIPSWVAHVSGVLGAMLLAVSDVFWQQATVAEVYTLNAFFVSLLLLWVVSPFSSGPGWLGSVAFLAGLSLTHHRTMLLLFPALGLYLYFIHGYHFFRWNILLPALALGGLPLLLYLYLPLRGHIGSLDGTYQNTWAGFWQQVTSGGYGTFLFDNPFSHKREVTFYWQLLFAQFYSLIPGFVGLLYLLWRRGGAILLTGLAFVTYLGFNLFYQVSDIAVFFIPIFLLWAVWSGVGVALFLYLVRSLKSNVLRYGLSTLLILLFAGGIFQQFQSNRAHLKAIYTWDVHDYGLDMLQQPLPTEAEGVTTIIGILGEMTLLRYFQQTEHRRPDIETVAADRESDRLAAVEQALSLGKNVYLTRELPGVAARWSLRAVGPLIQVQPQPIFTGLTPSIPLQQIITPEITLLGHDLARPSHTGPGPLNPLLAGHRFHPYRPQGLSPPIDANRRVYRRRRYCSRPLCLPDHCLASQQNRDRCLRPGVTTRYAPRRLHPPHHLVRPRPKCSRGGSGDVGADNHKE